MSFKKCFLIIVLVFVSNLFSQEKSIYKELSEQFVGKFLFDKNINIINDSTDIFIKVNNKGFCYAIDFVSNNNTKFLLDNEELFSIVDEQSNWIVNDSIINNSLQFEEYKSFGDYFSHKGREHRYDTYVGHSEDDNLRYYILNSDFGYAVLVESKNINFLTVDISNNFSASILVDEYIKFDSLESGMKFLISEEVTNKSKELKGIQDSFFLKEEEMKSIPVDSYELPYKFKFGMSESNVENLLKTMFVNYDKNLIENYSNVNLKKNGVLKEIEYRMEENGTLLKIEAWFFKNKLIKIGYSHWNKYLSRINDLDNKIKEKLDVIIKSNYLLFDKYFSESQVEGNHLIWCRDEIEKVNKEENIIEEMKYTKKKENENKIGNKM